MINIDKQITYWCIGADEAWEAGVDLIERGKTLYGLFFVHLAMEKILKAHVCKQTQELAPKIHALRMLSEKACLVLAEADLALLDEVSIFCIACRYPDPFAPTPSPPEVKRIMHSSERLLQWLKNRL